MQVAVNKGKVWNNLRSLRIIYLELSPTMSSKAFPSELEENFSPKEQTKDTAQTFLPRDVIKRFANRRSDTEGLKQFAFSVAFIASSQYLVCITNPQSTSNYFSYLLFCALNIAANIFCGYTLSFLFMGLHESVVCDTRACILYSVCSLHGLYVSVSITLLSRPRC